MNNFNDYEQKDDRLKIILAAIVNECTSFLIAAEKNPKSIPRETVEQFEYIAKLIAHIQQPQSVFKGNNTGL
mgnify:CR=1 FL=1